MPSDNSNDQNNDAGTNNDKNQSPNNPGDNNSNPGDNNDTNGSKEQNVPLNTFLDKKKELKEVKDKLAAFEARDKAAADAKLLEDEKYQEIIQNKEKELADAKSLLDVERKNNKLSRLENKFSNLLNKENVIDANDALKLIKYDDLLDSDDADNEIKSRVENLVKDKSYLFKATQSGRNNEENNRPSGNNAPKNQAHGKIDSTVDALSKILTN